MALKITREKNNRGVRLGSLDVGDTFLLRNKVGVIALDGDGRKYPLDLSDCKSFLYAHTWKKFDRTMLGEDCIADPDTIVLPIEVEVTYRVVG